jgi:hypothetical protein
MARPLAGEALDVSRDLARAAGGDLDASRFFLYFGGGPAAA